MKLIDLSQPVFDRAPNCPGHPPVRSEIVSDHDKSGWRLEFLKLASHTGSHLDAPLHKIAGGKSIDGIALERFVGPACLADLRDSGADQPITATLLRQRLPQTPLLRDAVVLLATGWGDIRAAEDRWLYHSPYLAPDGAQWLVQAGVRGVGIDHFSIGGVGPDNKATHEILLSAEVWILEELRFPAAAFGLPQPLTLWALPINLAGHTGAFCRPVLVAEP